jgi:hypothetical protein
VAAHRKERIVDSAVQTAIIAGVFGVLAAVLTLYGDRLRDRRADKRREQDKDAAPRRSSSSTVTGCCLRWTTSGTG